jgi:hypothetical protein
MRHADWLDTHGPRSWDPYDLWATTGGRRAKAIYYRRPVFGAIAATPFVFLDAVVPASRAVLWHRQRFPIADAHYAMGFCTLARLDRRRWLSRAWAFLDALVGERCPGEAEYCWGYPFDWETCVGLWKAWTPFITTTPYSYEAFETFHALTDSQECLTIMESIGRFAADRIRGVEVATGVKASTYSPFDLRRVVNASAYRGFILAAAGMRFERPEWIGEAKASFAFVLQSQRDDGSWLYAEDGKDAFVDNIHTCFVIKNLVKAQRLLADRAMASSIDRGWSYFKDNLLDAEGLPIPYALEHRPRLYRRDLYDYAETINLAQLLADSDPDAASIADRVVADLLERWTLPDGHFVTREMLIGRNTIPYVRWAQSQVFRALTLYALQDVT